MSLSIQDFHFIALVVVGVIVCGHSFVSSELLICKQFFCRRIKIIDKFRGSLKIKFVFFFLKWPIERTHFSMGYYLSGTSLN